jgi:hypothetical protein
LLLALPLPLPLCCICMACVVDYKKSPRTAHTPDQISARGLHHLSQSQDEQHKRGKEALWIIEYVGDHDYHNRYAKKDQQLQGNG